MAVVPQEIIHANSLALDDKGVLIIGSSGSGKSLLSLTLLERAQIFGRKAQLVADDYTELHKQTQRLIAQTPAAIAGAIEIRGAGIFTLPYRANIAIDLVVELSIDATRYPEAPPFERLGVKIPCLRLPLISNAPLLALCHAIEASLFLPRWSPSH